jgi:hypothetical protein
MEKKEIEKILTLLKINPNDYFHEKMKSIDVDIEDKLKGIIKISESYEEVPFNYISLSTYENNTKSIFFSTDNFNEEDLKNLVDMFSSYFGEDWLLKSKFNLSDLKTFRYEPSDNLRTWTKGGYKVIIGFTKKRLTSIYIGVYEL